MTVYVDEIQQYFYGPRVLRQSCHMMTDGDIEELHEMATKIGLKRDWFQDQNPRHPHYDLSYMRRVLALKNGAQEISSTEMIKRCVWKGQL